MGEEVGKKRVENDDFTLFYDYDQLRDRKLSKLSDDGKIEWFKYRMEAVFLNPLALTSSLKIFSIVMVFFILPACYFVKPFLWPSARCPFKKPIGKALLF